MLDSHSDAEAPSLHRCAYAKEKIEGIRGTVSRGENYPFGLNALALAIPLIYGGTNAAILYFNIRKPCAENEFTAEAFYFFSKFSFPCLHKGQTSGRVSPTWVYPQILQTHTGFPSPDWGLGFISLW